MFCECTPLFDSLAGERVPQGVHIEDLLQRPLLVLIADVVVNDTLQQTHLVLRSTPVPTVYRLNMDI